MEVNILGLCSPLVNVEELSGEIWSLNDWYRAYPQLPEINRLYELHRLEKVLEQEKKGGRYKGFKKYFETTGGKVIVDDDKFVEYLDTDVEVIRYDYLKSKYPLDFSCTVEIMVAEALDAGYSKINLCGVFLMGGNHGQYIKGVLKGVDYVREAGVEVICPFEKEWRENDNELNMRDYIEFCRKAV